MNLGGYAQHNLVNFELGDQAMATTHRARSRPDLEPELTPHELERAANIARIRAKLLELEVRQAADRALPEPVQSRVTHKPVPRTKAPPAPPRHSVRLAEALKKPVYIESPPRQQQRMVDSTTAPPSATALTPSTSSPSANPPTTKQRWQQILQQHPASSKLPDAKTEEIVAALSRLEFEPDLW